MSRPERDLAFDNVAAVADHDRLRSERIAASASFRARWPDHLNLPFGPHPRDRWDLYPADDAHAPCLLFIHGGYWQKNSRQDFACIAAGLMERGWSAALPGYPLAPDASLGTIVAGIGAALDWLAPHRHDHGISGPLLLCGWSAGATLAAIHLGHPAIDGGLFISGLYELAPLRDTGLNTALQLTDREIADCSPLRHPMAHKPVTIAYGEKELPALIENSVALHDHIKADRPDISLVRVAGANHFTILDELGATDGQLVEEACRLLA